MSSFAELGFNVAADPREHDHQSRPAPSSRPIRKTLIRFQPYDVLDEIVRRHVEEHQLSPQIAE